MNGGSVPMSEWSAVDAAADPRRLVAGLDALRAEPFFATSKRRMAVLLAAAPFGRVVDIGCGTGEDALALDPPAIGVERSVVMCDEARSRHSSLALVAGDAASLSMRDACVDAVRADRVIQHMADAPAALREWRRVLRPAGKLVSFDPDLTTASIDGVDNPSVSVILQWRVNTRPGAGTVQELGAALAAHAFVHVDVESLVLDLTDLDRADGIMGLAGWGDAAAEAGVLSHSAAPRWRDDVHAASRAGTLRYRCGYRLADATAG